MTAIAYRPGVDLGTTFTAAALVRDGRAEPVTLGSRVVADGEAPADVAGAWLREAGFIGA